MSEMLKQFITVKSKSDYVAGNEEDDDKMDETKRKSRNLSEKKRRDQFNTQINDLRLVVSSNNEKMDKSTVLKTVISNLRSYNDNLARSKEFEINEEYKPTFLTNEEYSFLTLQSLDGFIIVFSSCGKILYVCNGLALLLGYLVEEILNVNIFDMLCENDRANLENIFFVATMNNMYAQNEGNTLQFNCQFVKKPFKSGDSIYEPMKFSGFIKTQKMSSVIPSNQKRGLAINNPLMFIGIVQLLNPSLYNEVRLHDQLKTEFVSYHNFEWKFLFLDERAPSIIGYSPFEVLGTSGYNYYHVDDIDHVVAHHKTLMIRDKGVSRYYRFLTKGHQWIWLQTKSYINRKQWNTRVEYVVCTHRVINPLTQKNNSEFEVKALNHASFSSSSSTGTGSSNKTPPLSWPSTTSESNYCEEEDTRFQTCDEYFPDDNSMSSSTSSREISLHKKRKSYRRFQRSLGFLEYGGNNSDSSTNYPYSFVNEFQPLVLANPIIEYQYTSLNQTESNATNLTLEDSLQKKYTELQEELRVVSEQLFIARTANQQKSDANEINELHRTEETAQESLSVLYHLTNLYSGSQGVSENV